MTQNPFATQQEFKYGSGKSGKYYSLPDLQRAGVGKISRLPITLRIVVESALRNFDGKKITEAHIRDLVNWAPKGTRSTEVPFVVARVLLQDMTGVPLVVDFAAIREAAKKMAKNPEIIEPLCPGHLVIDHSVQVDNYGLQQDAPPPRRYRPPRGGGDGRPAAGRAGVRQGPGPRLHVGPRAALGPELRLLGRLRRVLEGCLDYVRGGPVTPGAGRSRRSSTRPRRRASARR